jgi:hypothetical protein
LIRYIIYRRQLNIKNAPKCKELKKQFKDPSPWNAKYIKEGISFQYNELGCPGNIED